MAFIGEFKNESTGMVITDAYYRITLIEYMPKNYLAVRVSVYLNKKARMSSKSAIAPKTHRLDGVEINQIESQKNGIIASIYDYLATLPEYQELERV